jgi:hypothetical protein
MGRRSSQITQRVTELYERGMTATDIVDWVNSELRDILGDKRLTDRGVKSMIQTYESHKEPEPGQEPPVVDLPHVPSVEELLEASAENAASSIQEMITSGFLDEKLFSVTEANEILARSLDRTKEPDPDEDEEEYTNNDLQAYADAYRDYLGTTWDRKKSLPLIEPEKQRSVVAVGDLHGKPNKWILQRITEENPDVIVIGGDMLDSKQVSPHPGTKKKAGLTMREEIANCRAFFEKLCEETTAEILVMRGNHDDWLNRRLTEADPELFDLVVDLYGDVLRLLMVNLPDRVKTINSMFTLNVPIGSVPPEVFAETPYLLALGDAMLSHINFSAKQPGAGVQKFSEWIYEWHRSLGLPEPSLCVQFHGHKSSLNSKQGGWLRLVEPGMAGDPSVEDYKVQYQGTWHPGSLDGCYFEQELVDGQWKTVQESVRLLSSR